MNLVQKIIQNILTGSPSNLSATSLEDYLKQNLTLEMSRQRGSKRIRKKNAKRVLIQRWRFGRLGLSMAMPILRRMNYSEVGRQMFSVEPLPQIPVHYINDYGE
jgi:hypothetical protein